MKKLLFSIFLCAAVFPAAKAEDADTLSISVIGDVMMHARQLEYPVDSFLENLTHILVKSDFAAANMEFSLGGEPYSGYPTFSAPDNYPFYAAGCGVNVYLLANNHVLDKGVKGLERTLRIYREIQGCRFTGAFGNAEERAAGFPLILREKGLAVALLNFTYGTNFSSGAQYPGVEKYDRKSIEGAIERARAEGADFVVALPHWGDEYSLVHNATQREWADFLVSGGVDVIVGAHPHVVQDTTHISRGGKKVPVIYSVGNAVSNMSAVNTRLELLVTLRFTRDAGGNAVMLEPELRFLWCSLPGMLYPGYATIAVDEYVGRRGEWLCPYDYDNMLSTLERVKRATGISTAL